MTARCRVCDRIADCTALLEGYLAIASAAVALNLYAHPDLMIGSRALAALLDWLPQPGWTILFSVLALIKVVSLAVAIPGWRLMSLGVGWVVWSHMTYVTMFETATPVLGPSIYGPMALASLVCFWAVIWRVGRACRND